MENGSYRILYQFWFNPQDKKEFSIQIDRETFVMTAPEPANTPNWTRLEHHQCPCCPLLKEDQPYCAIAINVAHIIETFKDKISYQKCMVRCVTPERTYQKKTAIMEGLSSIFGLIMAMSGCPVMTLFKPMARFHLPFATAEETMIRVVSFYLLGQYFALKNDHIPDLNLDKLYQHYENVKMLNAGLLSRFKAAGSKDSDKNALLTLHSFSELLSMEINTNLQTIEHLFVGNAAGRRKDLLKGLVSPDV